MLERGYIYKGSYAGWYCRSDEAYLTSTQIEDRIGPDGTLVKVSSESGHPVELVEEENYMFKLGALVPDVRRWVETSNVIWPPNRKAEILNMLDSKLPDLSISRPRRKLQWGIPVPHDPEQTIYVWVDALTNYLTAQGFPTQGAPTHPMLHVIGKDIVKFHCVYWPAFLLAAGLELPQQVLVHGHWTMDGRKYSLRPPLVCPALQPTALPIHAIVALDPMSKSLGNVVDPVQLLDQADGVPDLVRYYLLKESRLDTDGDFSYRRLNAVTKELADTVGNLLSRISNQRVNSALEFPGLSVDDAPPPSPCQELITLGSSVAEEVRACYDRHDFGAGIEALLPLARRCNALINELEPWKLARDDSPAAQATLKSLLGGAFESLRVTAALLYPVTPALSLALIHRLGCDEQDLQCLTPAVPTTARELRVDKQPLIPRVDFGPPAQTDTRA
ncbi:uncharacterized protein MONBRDRAFT_25711 [Monosiga brevicollis MX1]|uniref:methionine--tRNA ligase n=1 Tax=Monosiga brevicollis TaxID=81824 RepID=A9V073_MONBE|nr:uncharacterized protein MONBRDRAFT_25711 [Monosiga brevicollis MX1]EDQ88960.1 predicted protein [Monosiga brevicollis MX1]|eukprot:XP_001746065.1 hypothetical protein [Monosiga brevicollis MX1]